MPGRCSKSQASRGCALTSRRQITHSVALDSLTADYLMEARAQKWLADQVTTCCALVEASGAVAAHHPTHTVHTASIAFSPLRPMLAVLPSPS